MTAPAVSVVVVTYQSGPTLERCLAALRAQTFQDFETILADNGSADGAARSAAAADPSLRLLAFGENLGFAEANNRAAEQARGRWLALLNPDAFPEPDWLERLMAATKRHGALSFASLQLADDDPALLDGAGDAMTLAGAPYRAGWRRPRSETPGEGAVFAPCGAAMLIERALFRGLGGFEPSFFCYCEDMDLGYRLRLRGERTILVSDAAVRHVGSATLGVRSAFALRHGVRNRLWTYVRCTPPVLLAATAPLHAAMTALLVAASALKGERAALDGLREGLAGLSAVWRARRRIQAGRTADSLSIARAMQWNPLAALQRRPLVQPAEGKGQASPKTI